MYLNHNQHQRAGASQHNAANMIRLRHQETGDWLHMSGSGRTQNITYAWLGTKAQARRLRDQWKIGPNWKEPWPFKAVRRQDADKDSIARVVEQ